MLTVSRRGFLALGGTGAAGVALAACGTAADPRADASADQLTEAEASAETALAAAYGAAASALAQGEERAALEDFAAAAAKRAGEFGGGSAQAGETPPADGGPDSPEALDGAIRAANKAIAAHREAAGLLDAVDGRTLASSSMIACAAELAAVSHFAGKPEAPLAFVTGGTEAPFESATETEATTTSSTSTTSESTSTTEQP
ncbi:MAG: hypothetical protein ACHQJ5_09435 [Vicinamibacteria bacterium]|jgi:hypothetical protein